MKKDKENSEILDDVKMGLLSIIKRNIVFVIGYALELILCIVGILKINQKSEELFNTLSTVSYTVNKNEIEIAMIVIIIMCLAFSSIGLIYSLKNKLEYYRNSLIIENIVMIIVGSTYIISLYSFLALAMVFALSNLNNDKISIKKTSEEKNEEIPRKFRGTKKTNETYIYAATMIIIYFVIMFVPFERLFPKDSISIMNFTGYLVLLGTALILFKKEYKFMFNAFKKFKYKFKYIIKNWLIMLALYVPFAVVIFNIFGEANNQVSLSNMNVWYVGALSVIYAPIVEETVFRGALRKFIKNDILYVIISGFVFGLIHTIGQEPTFILTIARAVPYMVMGSYLSYIYVKNNNMMYNIGVHATQNLFGSIVMIIGNYL